MQAKIARNKVRQQRQIKVTDTGLCDTCEVSVVVVISNRKILKHFKQ